MSDKSFHFVCFPEKFLILSVSHHFFLVFGKKRFFGLKSRILVGNRQTEKVSKKMKSLSVLDVF